MSSADSFQDVLDPISFHFDRDDGLWVKTDGDYAFGYTDGEDFERLLLETVRTRTDRTVLSGEIQSAIVDWPSRYHLSAVRSNLLRPLTQWLNGRRVLEVGAGCGALTRFIGECGSQVLALEGSRPRARIAAARTSDLDNVSVLATPFQHVQPAAVFDLVTLVGVLEYARIFFPSSQGADAVDEMIAHAARFLRPGGTLLIAIENQLGLKYFGGYLEDHVAEAMFGIEDRYARNGVVTFGRRELGARVAAQGLPQQTWMYPFPDYKLPVAILTERGVEGNDNVDLSPLLSASVVADPQIPPSFRFSLERAWKPVFRNGLSGDLANSLVLLASADSVESLVGEEVLGWHFAVQRERCFAKTVTFRVGVGHPWADVERLCPALPSASASVVQQLKPSLFVSGEPWHERLVAELNRPGWDVDAIAEWTDFWLKRVLDEVGPSAGSGSSDLSLHLPGHMIDAVPRNLLVREDASEFIDLEWSLRGGVLLGHLCYRGVLLSLMAISSVATPKAMDLRQISYLLDRVMRALNFKDGIGDARYWYAQEYAFQSEVNGSRSWLSFDAIANYCLPVRTER